MIIKIKNLYSTPKMLYWPGDFSPIEEERCRVLYGTQVVDDEKCWKIDRQYGILAG